MVGGAAPILKQQITNACSAASGNCFLYGIEGPSSGQITGDSVIGIDFEGPNTTEPVTYDEWDLGIRVTQYANNALYAGNTFNNWEGDGGLELVGSFGGSATPCITDNLVAYNAATNCGGYGTVVVAGQNNTSEYNTEIDCVDGAENDETLECPFTGNVWSYETVLMDYGVGYSYSGGSSNQCADALTAASARSRFRTASTTEQPQMGLNYRARSTQVGGGGSARASGAFQFAASAEPR